MLTKHFVVGGKVFQIEQGFMEFFANQTRLELSLRVSALSSGNNFIEIFFLRTLVREKTSRLSMRYHRRHWSMGLEAVRSKNWFHGVRGRRNRLRVVGYVTDLDHRESRFDLDLWAQVKLERQGFQ